MKGELEVNLISKRDESGLDKVCRLRYHIYNHILKHHAHPGMKHNTQCLGDELDMKSFIFLAKINGLAVATLRVSPFDDLARNENVIFKHFKNISADLLQDKCALMSYFCILPEYHNSHVTKELLTVSLLFLVKKKLKRLFVETPDYLHAYYAHYQFSACSDWVHPKGYGDVVQAMTITTQALLEQGG